MEAFKLMQIILEILKKNSELEEWFVKQYPSIEAHSEVETKEVEN